MTGIGVFLACLAGLLSATGANVLLSEVPCKGDTAKQKYTLVFEGLWSAKRFPKQYPIYRPKASWSSLVGVTHNEEYTLWHKGETASEGVKLFAEKAGAFQLFSDIASSKGTSGKFFAEEIKKSGVGERKTDFAIDADHSKVSFMVKIVPSPDWFVGLDSKDLCQNGKWVDQFSTNLGPWDAGTDKGFTFTSPNWATVPQEPVFQISAKFPNHPANSFYYPNLRKLPALARVTLTREGADLSKLDELAELVEEAEEVVSLDCEVSNWSGFSRCTRQCGGGIKARSRYVKQKPLNGGKICPQLSEIVPCNTDPCDAPKADKNNDLSKPKEPVKIVEEVKEKPEVVALDCEVSKWSTFSKCNKLCGGGSMVRSRNITQKPLNGGKPCPELSESRQCNLEPCPVTKDISDNDLSKAKPETPAKAVEKVLDEPEVVATDCQVSDWSDFSKCNRRCGGGVMVRSRNITQKPSNGGKPCPELYERKQCNLDPCPVTKAITENDLSKPEPSAKTVEKVQDKPEVVATDCKVSDWSGVGRCSRRCGGGVMVRSRTITQKPLNGGKPCPHLYERKRCNLAPCPVTKAINVVPPKPQESAEAVEKAEEEPKVLDCKVSNWSHFSRCSRRCGGGLMVRSRYIWQKPLNGGEPCPRLTHIRRCNLNPCPAQLAISNDDRLQRMLARFRLYGRRQPVQQVEQ